MQLRCNGLEAKIQQLEDRHETEIKTLQAEIRRLREGKACCSRGHATARRAACGDAVGSGASGIFINLAGRPAAAGNAGESADDL